MNNVSIIGRLARDPDVRYTESGLAIANMTIAIDRGKNKDGEDLGADFPSVKVFGKQAENCEKYLAKGRMVAITGRIQTGSYEKNGQKVYTTDVIAARVKFIDWGDSAKPQQKSADQPKPQQANVVPSGFEAIGDDDIPF